MHVTELIRSNRKGARRTLAAHLFATFFAASRAASVASVTPNALKRRTLLLGKTLGGGSLTLPADLLKASQVRLRLVGLASGCSLGSALLGRLPGLLLTGTVSAS